MLYSLASIPPGKWGKLTHKWVYKLQHHFTIRPVMFETKEMGWNLPVSGFLWPTTEQRPLKRDVSSPSLEVIPVLGPPLKTSLISLRNPPSSPAPSLPLMSQFGPQAWGPPLHQPHSLEPSPIITSQGPTTHQGKYFLWGRSLMEKEWLIHYMSHFYPFWSVKLEKSQ